MCGVMLRSRRIPALAAGLVLAVGPCGVRALAVTPQQQPAAAPAKQPPKFAGMDDSVNTRLAEQAGRPARTPYINTESWGDLWNLILLSGGGIAGFVIGRNWNQIWGREGGTQGGAQRRKDGESPDSSAQRE